MKTISKLLMVTALFAFVGGGSVFAAGQGPAAAGQASNKPSATATSASATTGTATKPNATTVSGKAKAVQRFAEKLKAKKKQNGPSKFDALKNWLSSFCQQRKMDR